MGKFVPNLSGYFIKNKSDLISKKENIISKLTIRFETIKGYQSQVDWKEKINKSNLL